MPPWITVSRCPGLANAYRACTSVAPSRNCAMTNTVWSAYYIRVIPAHHHRGYLSRQLGRRDGGEFMLEPRRRKRVRS